LLLVQFVGNAAAFGRLAHRLAFVIHTTGLIYRMVLEGRPPVTNLYSSAIFIGWGAVVLGLVLEKIYRNGIGAVAAAGMGFITLIIAQNLAVDGDTMEMMRAVLDTNFWLATHVVAVTTGYASTFVAGFLALIYIVRGVFTQTLDEATGKSLARMVYGIVCFATLFSFVGTVLGGIWADQSWGRFWGWDPKENGALIIVLWNALILHAALGRMIRERGLVVCAIRQHRHQLVVVWREHARHRPAQLRLHRRGVQMAVAFCRQPAWRHELSLELGIHSEDLRAYILGEHGDTQFAAMSCATAGGEAIDDTPARRQLIERVTHTGLQIMRHKGFTNYGIALAATAIIEAVALDTRHTLPVSVLVNGFLGVNDVCLSLPAVVGRAGIERILQPRLNEAEAAAFRTSAAAVKKQIEAARAVPDGS
jgi:ABC-type transport system involved in cytochrome c biogenesis permease subunit